jgi:hypothetical protein
LRLKNHEIIGFMIIKRAIILFKIFTAGLFCLLFTSCNNKPPDGMLIITVVPGNTQNLCSVTEESFRYVSNARILALNPDNFEFIEVLTDKFYSACSPEISYDGKNMLFAAQQKENDVWQIWEMNLDNLKARKVTSLKDNCIDPVYLPGGRLVFSKLTKNDTIKTGYPLFTCNPDGSDLRQITFHPNNNFATTVLKDGRLLTISQQLLPVKRDPILMVLRPDGTKADMFYNGYGSNELIGRIRETSDGKLVFIEADKNSKTYGEAISINYNRPLHTRINLTVDINGSFNAVLPLRSDKFLVSFRRTEAEQYALCEFDPEKKSLGQTLYQNSDYDIIDITVAAKYDRPKKLPSEVDIHVKTGLLLCQDINVMGFQPAVNGPGTPKASMIEVLGIDSTYGIVPIEEDGSFYLKVFSDKPFQIRALDKDGHILYGPCSWVWLRPNERRGCVGCHEDPELVPVNRVPLAVKKLPVIIPVHVSRVTEKVVELE